MVSVSEVELNEDRQTDAPNEEPTSPILSNDEISLDVSKKIYEIPLLDCFDDSINGLFVYNNVFNLIPPSIRQFKRLKTLKYFSNEIQLLPLETGELVELECLQVKLSSPCLSSLPLKKLKSLKELEFFKVPQRPSAFSILSEVANLECLTKLTVCHFSIRYLPPEIGSLKKLEDLDLSFNKLKSLPDDIANLSSLKSLRIANNKLEKLPSCISQLQRLEIWDISNNRLTTLKNINLASMNSLQTLYLQYNKLPNDCQIPSWINYHLDGNTGNPDVDTSSVEVVSSGHYHKNEGRHSCKALRSGNRWKHHDRMTKKLGQKHLNNSESWIGEGCYIMDNIISESFYGDASEDNPSYSETDSIFDALSNTKKSFDNVKNKKFIKIEHGYYLRSLEEGNDPSDGSCIDSGSVSVSKTSCDVSPTSPFINVYGQDEESSSESSVSFPKSKRHSDGDLDNPKPSKCRRPACGSLFPSLKYSAESFCGVDDYLSDGFYDAGRDRPFMPLDHYEQNLSLTSREVILVDRHKDEELDTLALSAQTMLWNLKLLRIGTDDNVKHAINEMERISVLALLVSDYFGGSERSNAVAKMRKIVSGSVYQKPFVCTCSSGMSCAIDPASERIHKIVENLDFNKLCEDSLRIIKESSNSIVVPLGSIRFGVCRHRALLMKYLCDRSIPPIPCELVRGYLDFMPHAWNVIRVTKKDLSVRMIVDACYPTDIREENDPEYYFRYVPQNRAAIPVLSDATNPPAFEFPSLTLYNVTEEKLTNSTVQCKFGDLIAAAKIRTLEANKAPYNEIRNFELSFLGEVRILNALNNHPCIVQICGHKLSTKWVFMEEGNEPKQLLQSVIIMEYVKGGSLKNYMRKLSKMGEKHVPSKLALFIARDIACALAEMHSKYIIHRDIKSENVLIDLDIKREDGSPVVKMCDFDMSVPLHSISHSCCIAHFGVPSPDVCVGTPRWMAPEVFETMHKKQSYGLEADIWSYGCLLLELLTLEIPFAQVPENEIHCFLQIKQRPQLPSELDALLLSSGQVMPDQSSSVVLDSDSAALKFLVELFHKCTEGNPSDRPTASYIHNIICDEIRRIVVEKSFTAQ